MKLLIILCLLFLATVFPQQKKLPLINKKQNNVQYQPDFNFTAINQMKCWVSNTHPGAIAQSGFGNAIEWPGGRNAFKQLVFYDGLQLYGMIDGEERMMIQNAPLFALTIGNSLQPGRLLDDGNPDIPENPKYKIYKIQKDWEKLPFGNVRDALERDYNQWPVEDGAPWVDVDGDGFFSRGVDRPDFLGEEVMFFVANDADSSLKLDGSRNTYSKPFGIEFHVTTFAKQGTGILGDVVFRSFKMINKSGKRIEDFYVNWYSDIDVGYAADDGAGIDTSLGLAYIFNYSNYDQVYGEAPPAAGYVIIQTPKIKSSLSDSAFYAGRWVKGYKNQYLENFNIFMTYPPPPHGVPDSIYYYDKYPQPKNVAQFINTVLGRRHNGLPIINPVTGEETSWALDGDPISQTGWYDHYGGWGQDTVNSGAGDKYFQLSLTPFTFEPYDTQEVVVATLAAQGTDNIHSIEILRRKAKAVRLAYYNNFLVNNLPPTPKLHHYAEDEKVTLWWESNAEEFDEFDMFLENQDLPDTTYTFEGYIVEQYSDSLGNESETILIADKINGVTVIEDNQILNGVSVIAPVIFGSDSGLLKFIEVTEDAFSQKPLLSGQEYYFGIRAYAYSQFSDPTYLLSPKKVIKVIPGKQKIDFKSPYKPSDDIPSNQITGISDASVTTKIIDPSAIIDNQYVVKFSEGENGLAYDLINVTLSDTLLSEAYDINSELNMKSVFDGYILLMDNYGQDSINIIDDQNLSAIKNVFEIRNENGYLENPKDVLDKKSSNGQWLLTAGGFGKSTRENMNWTGSIGYDTYELRFTAEGSEYYTTGYGILFSERNDDPKGKGRVPFEVWRLSRDGTQEERMIIKIYDRDLRDTTWTQDEATNRWEMVYSYLPKENYTEPLPPSSGVSELSQHHLGKLIFEGELPKEETIIRITTFRPITDGDEFEIILEPAKFEDTATGKENIEEISVFPNPFFAGNNSVDQNYVRFIGLPTKATIRIFTLSGQLIRRLYKDDQKKFVDWDLQNENGAIISSGMYVAHIDMPGIGSKILKLAVVPSTKFLDTR